MKQLPLPQKPEITENIVDSVLAVNAAAGYVIWLIDELERVHRLQYRQRVKQTGNQFRNELLNSVNQVWLKGGKFDANEISQQQMDTYLMSEQMFKIALQLSRRSEDEVFRFKLAYENLLYSFKIDVPKQ